MGYNGWTFLDSPLDKQPSQLNQWEDVDLSGDLPAEATGIIVMIISEGTTSNVSACARGKEDTNNYMSNTAYCKVEPQTFHIQFVKLDSNRKFQVYSENAQFHFHVIAYSEGTDPKWKTVPVDVTVGSTGWHDIDVSAHVDADTTGVMLFLQNNNSSDRDVQFRVKGSTNDHTSQEWEEYAAKGCVVGIDANDKFQVDMENTAHKVYLVGEIKDSITLWTNEVSITDPGTSWTDRDLDDIVPGEVPADATGAAIFILNTSSWSDRDGFLRKNGTTWDPYTNAEVGGDQMVQEAVGVDAGNVFEHKAQNTSLDWYLHAIYRRITVGGAPVGKTLTVVYHVRNAVGDPLALQYNVRVLAAEDLAIQYHVRGLAADDLSLQYAVRGLAADDLTLQYAVQIAVGDDLTVIYDVESAGVGKTLTVVYHVRNIIAEELALQYHVRGLASDDLSLQYAVRGFIGKLLSLQYNVRGALGKTLTMVYGLRNILGVALTAKYDVRGILGAALDLIYDVWTHAPRYGRGGKAYSPQTVLYSRGGTAYSRGTGWYTRKGKQHK